MSLYPEVQRKVQEELDRVVGPDRLPEFWDHDNLVYLRATMLETMRWMVVAPLGVIVTEDRNTSWRRYDGSSSLKPHAHKL